MTLEKTTLPNGVRVATYKVDTIAANIGIFVGTGSRNEEEHEHGLSHFLEHMAFKRTAKRTSKEIAKEIEIRGGSTNAFTSKGLTAYYAKILPKDIELAFDILLDSVLNSVFDLNDIEIERDVIKQEIKMYEDRPNNIVSNKLMEIAYRDQKYGKDIIGTYESLDSFNRDHFVQYVKKWYVPNNMIVIATGSVNHSDVVKMVEQYTAHLATQLITPVDVTQYVGGYSVFNKTFEQVSMQLAFPTVGYQDLQQSLVFSMLSDYLGDGMSSPLFREVRENRGLVYGIGSGTSAIKETGLLLIGAGATPKNVNEIIDVSLDVIESVITDFDDEAFTRAKNQNIMQIGQMQESSMTMMRYIGGNWLMGEEFLFEFDDVLKKLDTITKQDIVSAAEQILAHPLKMSISLVGPVEDSTLHKVDALTRNNGDKL